MENKVVSLHYHVAMETAVSEDEMDLTAGFVEKTSTSTRHAELLLRFAVPQLTFSCPYILLFWV